LSRSAVDYSIVYRTSPLLLTMDVRATFSVTYFTVVALRPRSSHVTPPALPVRERLRELELWAPCRLRGSPKTGLRLVRRRGMRAGRRSQQLRELGHKCLHYSYTPAPANVSNTRSIVFGCLNIRSLINKSDDVTELFRDHLFDLLCLTESWCDSDSAVLGRLRNAGHNVDDQPRHVVPVPTSCPSITAASPLSPLPISQSRQSSMPICRPRLKCYVSEPFSVSSLPP